MKQPRQFHARPTALPDSLNGRRKTLERLFCHLTARHPAFHSIKQQLRQIDELLKAETEMQLKFKQLEARP